MNLFHNLQRIFLWTVVYWTLFVAVLSRQQSNSWANAGIVGLRNLGNTCYLNAQLQCAYHIPQVRRLVLEDTPSSSRSSSEAHSALHELFESMSDRQTSVISPQKFCAALDIPVFQQQDSQEFWKLLLPALKLPSLVQLYQGTYQDYIQALDGSGREKRKLQLFWDVSLDVKDSVEESLRQQFQKPELLSVSEGNGWRPEKGAPKVDAHKGQQLQGLPPILQLHLKRFHFDWNTETTSKLNTPCVFPVELDLRTLLPEGGNDVTEDPEAIYDLQGVVIHVGDSGQGHYYAYVRPDLKSDQWYRCNDEIVEQVPVRDVLCDSYGGKQGGSQAPLSIWGRLLPFLRKENASYGYGGPTSCAYVIQYVQRSAIPSLYLKTNQ